MRHPVYTRVTISNIKQHSSNNQKPTITFPINPIKYIYISIPAKHTIQNLSDTRYTCTLVYSHKQHFHCNRKQHNSHINSIIIYVHKLRHTKLTRHPVYTHPYSCNFNVLTLITSQLDNNHV